MVDTVGKVVGIISTHLGIALGTVVPGASLVDDLGADSLDTVELVIAFETAFDITARAKREPPGRAAAPVRKIGSLNCSLREHCSAWPGRLCWPAACFPRGSHFLGENSA